MAESMDPQIREMPAVSILSVLDQKNPNDIDDRTISHELHQEALWLNQK
jgi:hypothetical protein